MVARTRLLQLSVTVVNIAIVALAFTSVWPFPSGQFKVDLPSTEEVVWSVENGIVHITAPFSVDNHGFYDVKDLTVSYSVSNDTPYLIADDVILLGDLPAGQVTSSSIDFQFDLLQLFNSGAQWMVFHDDLIHFYVGVSCLYTMELVTFEATYQVQVPWDALIKSYGVSDVTYPSTPPIPGDPITVTVDYWLDTSSRLAGLPSSVVTVYYYGDNVELGHGVASVALGGNRTGSLGITVNPQIHSEYRVVIEMEVAGFTISRTIEAPPLWGLTT